MPRNRKERERRRAERANDGDGDGNGGNGELEEAPPSGEEIEAHGFPRGVPRGASGDLTLNLSEYTEENGTYYEREIAELQQLCDAASEFDADSWDGIRRWLRNHSAADACAAAEKRGDYETTPLHLACRNCPPADIVEMLLTAGPTTVELADSWGWLPLHYACANEASEEVLAMLAERHPASKVAVDRRSRTPLHFALGHTERPARVATVTLLGGTGAALMQDENGMLPLHYACAYGATEEALRVLTDKHIQTITATDNRGRTPLHFALGNADRPASPGVVGLLLSQNPAAADSVDLEGNLPIHLLATRAQAIKGDVEEDKCANCRDCLGLYLDARPRATADLLTALQSLPDWLRDSAVLSPVVQEVLNIKIARRFPTAVTILDGFGYVLVITFFHLSVEDFVRTRHDDDGRKFRWRLVIPLYVAVFYFCVREIVQLLSLASLGLFKTWSSDWQNRFDCVYIFLVLFWAIVMHVDPPSLDTAPFQAWTALSLAVFWNMVLIYLRNVHVGVAVFVGGVVYVTKRLLSFISALVIFLALFAQIFATLFQMTPGFCPEGIAYSGLKNNTVFDPEVSCVPNVKHPFCTIPLAFIKMFTMLLGEVDDSDFEGNPLANTFYALFMFICVIILANVLIAIVTDNWSVIQNERAAKVFWSNRLDFVAEMDVIYHHYSCMGRGEVRGAFDAEHSTTTGEMWKKFMYLFDDDIDDHGGMSFQFILYNILRAFAAFVILPLWVVIGFVSLGMLWPPQLREKFLTSQMTGRTEQSSEERNRLNQVNTLKEEVSAYDKEMRADMEKGRNEMNTIKAVLGTTKTEIHTEMNEVKEIVTELFELLSAP